METQTLIYLVAGGLGGREGLEEGRKWRVMENASQCVRIFERKRRKKDD